MRRSLSGQEREREGRREAENKLKTDLGVKDQPAEQNCPFILILS